MALLTRDDLARQSRFAWASLAVLLGIGVFYAATGRVGPAIGTIGAVAGLLALVLPPRERMPRLPPRLRALPRRCDAAPVLGTILSSPGYGLGWFYGPNPYDEIVHLLNGLLIGLVLAEFVLQDGRRRDRRGFILRATAAGLALAVGWEAFEWLTGLIGHAVDTVTDIALTTLGTTLGALAGERLHASYLAGSATPRPATTPGAAQQSTAPSERVQKGTGAGGVGWAQ
jgi:hypothetical protein